MKHFLNDRDGLVMEAIETAVQLGGGKLARLDGFPGIKVVVRTDWDRSQVAVVSGGGAGHEPAHVGFVGDGMLTAAVCGEVFASPSVDAVLAGIVAVTGKAGCLLVVKNYTGDRLNFGLAAEKARALGFLVEMVVVGDDVALPDAPRPRGVAGTLFVHKVAGHVARTGASLGVVKAAAEAVAHGARTIGLSLSSVELPGHASTERLGAAEVELGLGIHGEPGAKVVPMQSVDALAALMVDALAPTLGSGPHAVLLNNLGGVSSLEMATVARSLLGALVRRKEVAIVFGPAPLMTSLDMKGVSLSALPLGVALEEALLSPVGPAAWPAGARPVSVAPVPVALRTLSFTASADPARRAAVETIARTLVAQREALDALDAKVGDGDAGTTFAAAGNAVLADLDRLPFADAPALAAALADRLSKVMGGSSGILLAIFTSAVGVALGDDLPLVEAVRAGVARIQEYGGARLGDRTMLDALIPAVDAWSTGHGGLPAAAKAARAGAEKTATMGKARAGRSSYVREDALRGIPDPGAVAVAVVLEALAAP